MVAQSFHIVLLSQEAGRPEEIHRALQEFPPPPEAPIAFRGFRPSDLTSRGDEVAAALREASVVLVTHVLMDDTANEVVSWLDEHCGFETHILAINCLEPVLRRTRLRGWRFSDGEGLGFLSKPRAERRDMTSLLQDLLKGASGLLERLPKDRLGLRTFLEAYLYWTEPAPINLRNLVLMLADRCSAAPSLWAGHYEPARRYPKVALYHPVCGVTEDPVLLPRPDDPTATLGLLLMRGAVLSEETAPIDALIGEFESRGFRVLAAFAESFDFREAVTRYFDAASVDAIVSLTGFPLVGGHNRCDADAARAFLEARDVLYLTPCALMVQDVASWERSGLGLSPMEVAMQVSIHELEGGLEPTVVHAMAKDASGKTKGIIADRVVRFADRLERWLRLRRLDNKNKRVLLTLFSFPPGKGSVGTAAYLDVFQSAMTILQRLSEEGYTVELPASAEDLLRRVVEGDDKFAPIGSAGLAVGARIDLKTYERIAPDHERVARMWGPAPGSLNSDGRHLLVHGVDLGNVFVGVQPSFGFEGDPMRLLFDRGATPHHGFLAYYRWAEEVFKADALVHLGTHGALEFMPGKQAGLSARCWPDILAGSLPNIYVYAVNNPSEGTIAKRRGHAVTVGHLTPPSESAGLYRELSTLKGLIAEYRERDDEDHRIRIMAVIAELVRDASLDQDLPLPEAFDSVTCDRFIGALYVALTEIEARRIPVGLHTLGRSPRLEERVEILTALANADPRSDDEPSLPEILLRRRGLTPRDLEERARQEDAAAAETLHETESIARALVTAYVTTGEDPLATFSDPIDKGDVAELFARLRRVDEALHASDEISPLVAALAGRYVPPGPGGDPVKAPAVLPVGRNLHALDPSSVPSPAAWARATHTVDLLLKKHREEHGVWPRHLGMVLWGLDNIKTHGEGVAQVLYLMGVRPLPNSIGRITRLEVMPTSLLERPRVDVTVTVSGIFRDVFGLQMELLDRAVRRVAALDEPLTLNPLAARTQRLMGRGFSATEAATRIFSNAPGAYGTYLDHMVNLSRWENRGDLAASFLRRKGFAYGMGEDGRDARELLAAQAIDLDATFQNLDSSEVSLTDVDHYFEYLGGLTALAEHQSGRRPKAFVADATGSHTRIRSLEATVRLEVRTKLLNPKWYEGMLHHGYEGAEEIKKRLEYTFGFSATCEAVDPWVYRDCYRRFVEDADVKKRLENANPHAFNSMVTRLLEAGHRGFWSPTGAEADHLREVQHLSEDALEGVF